MINVGNLIFGQLNAVARTYPLVAENTTKFPFIVYRTTTTRPIDNKDMVYNWIHDVQVNVVDDHYDTACSLSESVINNLMELEKTFEMQIESISEDFQDDAYIKTINIRIYT